MRKSFVLLAALSLMLVLVSAGCLDLFNVPGIALSPDGNTIVFLSGEASLSPTTDEDTAETTFDLSRADLTTGETTVLAAGSEDTLITSFDINPTNGDIVYLATNETSGTTLNLVGADGSTREVLGASALPGISIGTMMAWSPDGNKLAFTLIQLPPDLTLDAAQDEDNELTPEQAKAIKFVAYILDVGAGNLTPISNVDSERANTIAWSPSSNRLAYNSWVDDNADGIIATVPSMMTAQEAEDVKSDLTRISIYDLTTGINTPINDVSMNFAPIFLSDDRLAYVSMDLNNLATFPTVKLYDLLSTTSGVAYAPTMGGMLGLSLSPDGTQLAWVEAPGDMGDDELPATLYVSGTDFAEPRAVTTLPIEVQLSDTPIWTPDGQAVLISVTNVLATIPDQISMSFSIEGSSSESEGGASAQVLRVDVASGQTSVVYKGAMINSSFFSGLFGLTTSGSLDQMFGGLGEGE